MTIAKKINSKISKVREKFGKPLIMQIYQVETGKNIQEPRRTVKNIQLYDYLTVKNIVLNRFDRTLLKPIKPDFAQICYELRNTQSDLFNPLFKINWRTLRNLNCACCICGETKDSFGEMHHIKAIHKEKVVFPFGWLYPGGKKKRSFFPSGFYPEGFGFYPEGFGFAKPTEGRGNLSVTLTNEKPGNQTETITVTLTLKQVKDIIKNLGLKITLRQYARHRASECHDSFVPSG
jgi:hypothetical protein